jgi:hypothetical protein
MLPTPTKTKILEGSPGFLGILPQEKSSFGERKTLATFTFSFTILPQKKSSFGKA